MVMVWRVVGRWSCLDYIHHSIQVPLITLHTVKKNLLKVTKYYGILDDVKMIKKSITLVFLHCINQSFWEEEVLSFDAKD